MIALAQAVGSLFAGGREYSSDYAAGREDAVTGGG